MKRIPFFLLLAFLSVSAYSQDDFSSTRLDNAAGRLKRDTVDLVQRTTDELNAAQNANRALIDEVFLAAQIDASVGIFQDMIRDRRRASELREAGAILGDLARRAPSVTNNGTRWRAVRNGIADLNRELGAAGNTGSGTVDNRPVIGRVYWRGMVDGRLQLVIRGGQVESRTISGQTMPDGTFSFTSPLPAREVSVSATRTRGRGTVKVLQQPSKENEYTAIVEVYDDGGGARDYQLDIFWK